MADGETRRASSQATRALLFSPVAILIASATRLLIVANYDTTTATSIAAAGGLAGTLLGTVVPLFPAFLPYVVVGLVALRRPGLAVLAGLAAAVVSPAYAPPQQAHNSALLSLGEVWLLFREGEWSQLWDDWRVAVIAVGAGALLALLDYWRKPIRALLWVVGVSAACLYSSLFVHTMYEVSFDKSTIPAIMRRPWVPAEEIVLNSSTVYVGYTLSTKDRWQIILRESDRTIVIVPGDAVVSREVCRLPDNELSTHRDPLIKLGQNSHAPNCDLPKRPDLRRSGGACQCPHWPSKPGAPTSSAESFDSPRPAAHPPSEPPRNPEILPVAVTAEHVADLVSTKDR